MTKKERCEVFWVLAKLEPGLSKLLSEAKAVKDDPKAACFCANAAWYSDGRLKSKLLKLVGWGALSDNPELNTEHAYDVAYDHIYDALPNCRHDGLCWHGEPLIYEEAGR